MSAPGAKRCRTSDPGPGQLWASLSPDLVRLVAWRVLAAGDLLDYVRFRAVCTGWRSAAVSPRGRGVTDPRFHPRRWMMLPEGHCLYPGHPDLHGYARFLNLRTGALVRVRIPLLQDHLAIDSVAGLLLLLGDQYQQGTVCLLHPFTGDITHLPPLATLLPQLLDTSLYSRPVLYRIKCLAFRVRASASFQAGVVTAMLALDEVKRIAFATSADRRWNMSTWKYPSGATPLGFQGKLYMLDRSTYKTCRFLQVDPPLLDGAGSGATLQLQPPNLIATIPKSKFIAASYLVECDSEILVLALKKPKSLLRILACKLGDLVLQKRFIPVKDIGNNTLFVGERCMSVSSKVLSTIKGDNVVCNHPTQPYLAQYHMSSGKWSPAIDDCSLYGRAPGPSHLVHYIFSCCTRSLWNRGIVFRMTPPGSLAWWRGGQVSR